MGLLDDLKNQAATQLQREQSSRETRDRNLHAVDRVLRETQNYFIELSNSLNILKPKVYRSFILETTVQLDRLQQADYAVRERRKTVDNRDHFLEVALRFRNAGTENLLFEKDTPTAVERSKEYLWGYGLRFECKEINNDRRMLQRAVFSVISDVQASATFTGDWDSGKVRLVLRNIEKLGDVEYLYDAEEVTREVLEELAKLVLGQQNNLRNLGNYQEMMRSTSRGRSLEIEYPKAPSAEQPELPTGGSLLGNLKSLLKR